MTAFQFFVMLVVISASLSLIMGLAWLIQQRTGNSGWVDTVWAFGLGLIGAAGALFPIAGGLSARQGLVGAAILVWSLRLGLHIGFRTSGIQDDPRYAELRRGWKENAAREMFWFLQKQALVSIPLAMSVILAAWNPVTGLRLQDTVGVLVIAIGIGGAAIADLQLRRFRIDPANKGRVCDVGLWGFSRHPNYFFEWLGWLAYPLFAVDLAGDYPWGWLALGGPACMYWLLVHVSGIPPLEQHMVRTRGDAFRDYQARVSAFFPALHRTG